LPPAKTVAPGYQPLQQDGDASAPRAAHDAAVVAKETVMKLRTRCLLSHLMLLPLAALGAGGLATPEPDEVWPQWQARITLQSVAVSPLSLARPLDSTPVLRGGTGTAVLGDYVFAPLRFGSFRASGGLMLGNEASSSVPYLGLGFSSLTLASGLSLNADLGWIAEGSLGRALFGSQGSQAALREMRLAPVLQLGLRYAF
jgi:hypothetical protein